MSAAEASGRKGIRYQPDESPPPALALDLGVQLAVLSVTGIILIPMVALRAGGAS